MQIFILHAGTVAFSASMRMNRMEQGGKQEKRARCKGRGEMKKNHSWSRACKSKNRSLPNIVFIHFLIYSKIFNCKG